MLPERQREIAKQGGRAAYQQGVAHGQSREKAKDARTKGGQAAGKRGNDKGEENGREIIR